jgi:hypothetical protein
MAIGDLTIGIAGATSTTFATSPIPSLRVYRWTADGSATRSRLGYAELRQRSINGVAQINGPTHAPKFVWSIATVLTLNEMRQLSNLANYQDDQYKSQADGKLRFIDEIQYLDNFERAGRTLLSETAEAWNASYKYGYGVFAVKLQLPEEFNTELGLLNSDGSIAHTVTFQVLEV